MADLKTTQGRAILDAESADMGAAEVVTSLLVLSDLDTLLAENAKLRGEVDRLRGEVASLALLVNPQAARDAAATARENRAARAILAVWEDDDLVGAARSAMAMVELYKAMWRRDMGYTQLARQAMAAGLAECERLRGALRGMLAAFDGARHDRAGGAVSARTLRDWARSRLEVELLAAITPRPLDEWHEDDGPVLWWRFPIEEPPYVGWETDDDFPDYVTHWTKIPIPEEP